jgi:hypothetical protein
MCRANTALSCARRLKKPRARKAREGAPPDCEQPSPRVSFNALFACDAPLLVLKPSLEKAAAEEVWCLTKEMAAQREKLLLSIDPATCGGRRKTGIALVLPESLSNR